MIYTIENDKVCVKINDLGAEIKSIYGKNSNFEYIWHGSPDYWKRSAIVLFPICGRLFEGKYTYNGKEYEMSIEYDPNYDIAYNNLGVIYLDDLGRVKKSIELFKKSIECNPNYALAHFNLARAITITGDKIEAAKLYQIAQDINKVTNEIDPQDIIDKINGLFS